MPNDDAILETHFEPTCKTSKRAITSEEHSKRLDIALDIRNLTIAYNGEAAIWNLDLQVAKGDVLALAGPMGAGKSTLLKAVMGLADISAGKIFVFGRPAKNQKKMLAFMPEKNTINWEFPLSLLNFVLIGTYPRLGWIARPLGRSKQDANGALKKTGLFDIRHKQIGELSASEKQRALVARALAQEAEIYLLDEPFSGADRESETIVEDILATLRKNGKTVIAVQQDIYHISKQFNSLCFMNSRKIALGSVNEVLNSNNINNTYRGKSSLILDERVSLKTEASEIKSEEQNIPVGEPKIQTAREASFKEIFSCLHEDFWFSEDLDSLAERPQFRYMYESEQFDDPQGENSFLQPIPKKEEKTRYLTENLTDIAEIPEEDAIIKKELEGEFNTNTSFSPVQVVWVAAPLENKAESPIPINKPFRNVPLDEQEENVWRKITEFTKIVGNKKKHKNSDG